ncbi:MAG: Putative oxidoreductase, partial [uncultured Thermomicrobiales bacterium]
GRHPRRDPDPAAARHLRADPAGVAGGGRQRRRHPVQLGPLLPALRRPGRRAPRQLDRPGGDGRGHRAGRDRVPRGGGRLPQPPPARRHGADARPRLRRPLHPGDRKRLEPTRLRGVRVPVRDRGLAAPGPRPRHAGDRRPARAAEPGSGPRVPADPDRRRRGEGDPPHRRPARHDLERPGGPGSPRAQEPGPRRMVRRGGPGPGGDRALGADLRAAARPARRVCCGGDHAPDLRRERAGLRPRAAPEARGVAGPPGGKDGL